MSVNGDPKFKAQSGKPFHKRGKQDPQREDVQCLLLGGLRTLVGRTGLDKIPTKRIYNFTGNPETITSIINDSDLEDFMLASPAALSTLQPKLKFWFTGDQRDDEPIYFSDHVLGEQMVSLRDFRLGSDAKFSPASQRGFNVGIKSFEWAFDNKHEGDKIVKANLVLYYGSLAEMVNEYYLRFMFANGTRNLKARHGRTAEDFAAAELEQLARLEKLQEFARLGDPTTLELKKATTERNYLQLKCEVGWEVPDGNPRSLPAEITPEFKKAIESTNRTLILNLTKYNLSFNQNGSVEVNLDYIASIDSYLVSPQADVLAGRNQKPDLQTQRHLIPLNSGWFSKSRQQKVVPNGYIYNCIRHRPENCVFGKTSMWDFEEAAFECAADGVLAEIEWLEGEIELREMKNNKSNQSDPTHAPSQVASRGDSEAAKLKAFLEEAYDVHKDVQAAIRTQKYSSFMDTLVSENRLFVAKFVWEHLVDQPNPEFPQRVISSKLKIERYGKAGGGQVTAQQDKLKIATKDKRISTKADEAAKKNALDPTNPYDEAWYENAFGFIPTTHDRSIKFNAFYVRAADVIEAAMECAGLRPDFKLALGTFAPAQSGIPNFGPNDYLSIGDIPISIDYFGQWFVDNVVSREKPSYSFRRFLDDFINRLLLPLCNYVCVDTRTNISIDYTTFTCLRSKKLSFPQNSISDTDAKNFQEVTKLPTGGRSTDDYYFVYVRQLNPDRNGNITEDREDGIYHLFVGADRGLAKEFSFTEKAMPQLRAMNIESNNQGTKAGILILPQDVQVSMVGNTFFRNGSMVYINAEMGVGQRVADTLKLGGYYRVFKSTNKIEPGSFATTVECIFERSRTGG
jgi:hypothetical protein